MDKVLLIIGIIVVLAILITGGFGLFRSTVSDGPQLGFSLFSSGPIASGPDGAIDSNIVGISPEEPLGSTSGSTGNNSQTVASKSLIKISSVNRVSGSITVPTDEYVVLRHTGSRESGSVNIASWSLANSEGKHYWFGTAQKIAFFDTASPVVLKPGEEVYIHTGISPFGQSFQESACTGYLNQNYRFNPSLGQSCPQIDVRNLLHFKDACLQYIEQRVSSCRTPQISQDDSTRIGNECGQYIADNFNYAGCVKNFRIASDFYRNRWHLYLSRTEKLWRELHDRIILYDEAGAIISIFTY